MHMPVTTVRQRITIAGYPPTEAVIIQDAEPDMTIHGEGSLLSIGQAMPLLDAWRNAPAADNAVTREWTYSACGLFVTALYIDGEIVLSMWESAIGADGTDRYSTVTMPFDFEMQEQDR